MILCDICFSLCDLLHLVGYSLGPSMLLKMAIFHSFYGITSWEIDGETVETMADFIFGGSKIIADGDCSHEIKRHFSLEGKL